MFLRKILIASGCLLPVIAVAAGGSPVKAVQLLPDRQAVNSHLRSLGYTARGGVGTAATERDESGHRSFPHFSSSFTVNSVTYPFTMVGYRPQSGKPATFKSVIFPLRMNFVGFGPNQDINHTFEPGPAVTNVINSPMYMPAAYPGGFVGQFVDSMQRAAFWNKMDADHNWHVQMDSPTVAPTIDIEVTPETGTLFQDGSGNWFGDVLIDFIDAEERTIIQLIGLDADTLPIFVTDMVTAQALGYHNAYTVAGEEGGMRLQTLIYTSWLDPAVVDPLFADVSTFNHELAEWMNDPFVNNVVPTWKYPPDTDPRTFCSGNPFLEVGDPQGNGPTFDDFPTAVITIAGVGYHLQQLVLWEWFTDEVPSTAFGGWYTFPIPSSLTVPAVYCQ
jgi:hypothetical protein